MKLLTLLSLLTISAFAQDPIVTSFRWDLSLPGIGSTENSKLMIMVAPQKPGVAAILLDAEVTVDNKIIVFTQTNQLDQNGTIFVIPIPKSTSTWSIKRKITELVKGESFEVTEVK